MLFVPSLSQSETKTDRPPGNKNGRLNGGQGQSRVQQRSASHRAKAGHSYPRPTLDSNASAALREQLSAELEGISSAEDAANWAHRVLGLKNTLSAADAEQVEQAFRSKLTIFDAANCGEAAAHNARADQRKSRRKDPAIDKSMLGLAVPRRIRDRNHVKSVAKQTCLVCGRSPADAHHLRFAQSRALGRKVSDEFTVPLCRGHHREVHRCGNEAAWWKQIGIDPATPARVLWLKSHPLPTSLGQPGSKLQNEPNLVGSPR
jgi:hypothetical protein